MESKARVEVLGGLAARDANGETINIDGRKHKALLGFLACKHGEHVSRELLCGLLWGDHSDVQARSSLRHALTSLRRCFGEDLPLIGSDRDCVWLDATSAETDVEDFRAKSRLAVPDGLEQAVKLYRGALLNGLELREDEFNTWLSNERRFYHEMACEACRSLLRKTAASSEQILEIARYLLALEPCDEEAHRALMKAYALQGNTSMSLRQYQICGDALKNELGLAPSNETDQLASQIRQGGLVGTGNGLARVTEPVANRPSVAVLPFENKTGDPEQQFLADGMTEDIRTELSRFHSLYVRARNDSVRKYGQSGPRMLGHELGVQYVVDGSVRKLADRIRVAARLIDVSSGNQLWGENFDRDQQDIFAVQDEIVERIAARLAGRLASAGLEVARRKHPASLAAYELVLRGLAIMIGDAAAETEAVKLLERAISIDPNYARAYSTLGYLLQLKWFREPGNSTEMMRRAFDLTSKAVSLDETDGYCHYNHAWNCLNLRLYEQSDHHRSRAMELTPNDPDQAACRGVQLIYLGEVEDALRWFKRAHELDPNFEPTWFWRMQGIGHFIDSNYEAAIVKFKRSPNTPLWVMAYLAACYAITERVELAKECAVEVLRLEPRFSSRCLADKEPFKREQDRLHLLEGLRLAGLPE